MDSPHVGPLSNILEFHANRMARQSSAQNPTGNDPPKPSTDFTWCRLSATELATDLYGKNIGWIGEGMVHTATACELYNASHKAENSPSFSKAAAGPYQPTVACDNTELPKPQSDVRKDAEKKSQEDTAPDNAYMRAGESGSARAKLSTRAPHTTPFIADMDLFSNRPRPVYYSSPERMALRATLSQASQSTPNSPDLVGVPSAVLSNPVAVLEYKRVREIIDGKLVGWNAPTPHSSKVVCSKRMSAEEDPLFCPFSLPGDYDVNDFHPEHAYDTFAGFIEPFVHLTGVDEDPDINENAQGDMDGDDASVHNDEGGDASAKKKKKRKKRGIKKKHKVQAAEMAEQPAVDAAPPTDSRPAFQTDSLRTDALPTSSLVTNALSTGSLPYHSPAEDTQNFKGKNSSQDAIEEAYPADDNPHEGEGGDGPTEEKRNKRKKRGKKKNAQLRAAAAAAEKQSDIAAPNDKTPEPLSDKELATVLRSMVDHVRQKGLSEQYEFRDQVSRYLEFYRDGPQSPGAMTEEGIRARAEMQAIAILFMESQDKPDGGVDATEVGASSTREDVPASLDPLNALATELPKGLTLKSPQVLAVETPKVPALEAHADDAIETSEPIAVQPLKYMAVKQPDVAVAPPTDSPPAAKASAMEANEDDELETTDPTSVENLALTQTETVARPCLWTPPPAPARHIETTFPSLWTSSVGSDKVAGGDVRPVSKASKWKKRKDNKKKAKAERAAESKLRAEQEAQTANAMDERITTQDSTHLSTEAAVLSGSHPMAGEWHMIRDWSHAPVLKGQHHLDPNAFASDDSPYLRYLSPDAKIELESLTHLTNTIFTERLRRTAPLWKTIDVHPSLTGARVSAEAEAFRATWDACWTAIKTENAAVSALAKQRSTFPAPTTPATLLALPNHDPQITDPLSTNMLARITAHRMATLHIKPLCFGNVWKYPRNTGAVKSAFNLVVGGAGKVRVMKRDYEPVSAPPASMLPPRSQIADPARRIQSLSINLDTPSTLPANLDELRMFFSGRERPAPISASRQVEQLTHSLVGGTFMHSGGRVSRFDLGAMLDEYGVSISEAEGSPFVRDLRRADGNTAPRSLNAHSDALLARLNVVQDYESWLEARTRAAVHLYNSTDW